MFRKFENNLNELIYSDPGAYSQFTMLSLLDLKDAAAIGRQICLCLSVGSVPVIMASEDMWTKFETFLPFNQVLEWGRVVIKWRMGLSEVNFIVE